MIDKQKHLILSFILTLLFYVLLNNLLIAGGVVLFIGLFKEIIYDKLLKKGKFEWLDIVANILGILTFIFIIWMI